MSRTNLQTRLRQIASKMKSRLIRGIGRSRNEQQARHLFAALQWVTAHSILKQGIRISNRQISSYPEVTGYFIPTLLQYGELEFAVALGQWLVQIQNQDGSWSEPAGGIPYTFDTGQVLKGLVAILPRLPEVEPAIRRGCNWLLTQIQSSGRVTTPDKGEWQLPHGELISENIHLYALEPLRQAGAYFQETRYTEACERALAYYLQQTDLTAFNTLSHFHAYVLEALVDLGYPALAAQGMSHIELLQRRDGAVPAYPDVNWVCATGIAQYAVIWYKLGQRERAQKALEYLCKIQNSSGGFYDGYGRGANYFPDEEISWAIKFFLDAYYWHIRTTFDAQAALWPDTISANDGQFQAILQGLGDLSGLRVLDAGCGKGRFAKALLTTYASAEIWGVDLSDAMLGYVPPAIKTRQGSLVNLPFKDGYFDHAYCVEAIEHSIKPETAIAELCRVVKPGGRIIVVDKNEEKHGALEIEAWEQWFKRSEVETWLGRYCVDVRSLFTPYEDTIEPDGLFITWQGTRR